ncbi:MAG: ParB/RepB/Spo0J family partition protein [Candidatus Bathyarchaeia archaeon]
MPALDGKRVGLREIEVSKITMVKSGRLTHPIDVSDLAEDIRVHGLLEPIVVEEIKGGFMVLAGGRRYFACKQLGLEKVPAVVYRDLSREERLAIIFSENVRRKDFSVVEQAMLVKEFTGLGHSPAEAAEVFGVSEAVVQQLLDVVEKLPDVVRDAIVRHGGKVDLEACVLLTRMAESGVSVDSLVKYVGEYARGNVTVNVLRGLASRSLPEVQAKPVAPPAQTVQPPPSSSTEVSAEVKPAAQVPQTAPAEAAPAVAAVMEKEEAAAVEEAAPSSQMKPVLEAAPTSYTPYPPAVEKESAAYILEFVFSEREKYDLVYSFFAKEDGSLDCEKLYQIVRREKESGL